MSIVEAMAAVMSDVQAVAKSDRNSHQNFNFRGIDAVVNAVGPALRTHGVVVVPTIDSVEYADVKTTNDKRATACRLTVTYTFWHGNTYLPCQVQAEAWDHGDKATPKAMSVAFRTALLQALALPTDEPDPDSHTYEQAASTSATTTPRTTKAPVNRSLSGAAERPSKASTRPTCALCAKPITGSVVKAGEGWKHKGDCP
jgi:hypothetical protein